MGVAHRPTDDAATQRFILSDVQFSPMPLNQSRELFSSPNCWQICVNCWSRSCVVTRLTVALLAISVFTPTVFAQCVQQRELNVEIIRGTEREYQNVSSLAQSGEQKDRFRVFSAWLEMVKGAERDYKNKNGRYGNLVTLRKAHLLCSLVFESDSSAALKGKSQDNFVPKETLFQVTVSGDGQHFSAVIGDNCASVISYDQAVNAHRLPAIFLEILRDIPDSPDGPIISVAR
jgi:hypothetical protein